MHERTRRFERIVPLALLQVLHGEETGQTCGEPERFPQGNIALNVLSVVVDSVVQQNLVIGTADLSWALSIMLQLDHFQQ